MEGGGCSQRFRRLVSSLFNFTFRQRYPSPASVQSHFSLAQKRFSLPAIHLVRSSLRLISQKSSHQSAPCAPSSSSGVCRCTNVVGCLPAVRSDSPYDPSHRPTAHPRLTDLPLCDPFSSPVQSFRTASSSTPILSASRSPKDTLRSPMFVTPTPFTLLLRTRALHEASSSAPSDYRTTAPCSRPTTPPPTSHELNGAIRRPLTQHQPHKHT